MLEDMGGILHNTPQSDTNHRPAHFTAVRLLVDLDFLRDLDAAFEQSGLDVRFNKRLLKLRLVIAGPQKVFCGTPG
jgi:hypothetical protein